MKPPAFTEYTTCTSRLQKIGFTLWIYAAIQFVFSGMLSFPAGLLGLSLTWLILLGATVLSGAIALAAGLDSTGTRITGLRDKPRKGLSTYLQVLCMMYFFSMVSGIFFTIFGVNNDVMPQTYGLFEIVISFLTAGILGPILEELFFRGFVFGCLRRYGDVFAALISSLAFALLHLNFVQGVPVFFFGLLFCWAYRRTGSLWIPIALHITNNMIALLAGYAWWLGFLILAAAAVGFVLLLIRLPKAQRVLDDLQGQSSFFHLTGYAPAFWSFAAFSLIVSIVQVIWL